MKNTNVQKQSVVKSISGKQRNYNEVVEFLDTNWTTNSNDKSLSCIKQLDKAFGSVSQKINTILIGGTNGKSLTAHFVTKLLSQEGLSVGAFYSPHILNYNERISINQETISNKVFTDLANEVINTALTLELKANTMDVLTMMLLLHCERNTVDVAVCEVSNGGAWHPLNICNPKIVAITRITDNESTTLAKHANHDLIKEITSVVKKGTHTVSADQSKINLQVMQTITEEQGGTWCMPIRKLAPLPYPFEQLHGRCAALAERTAQDYVNEFANSDAIEVTQSLLTKQKGQRGRPTLEAKRQAELNPRKTIEQYWKETCNTLPARFQLLDKEKPTLLLDNASNLDAFNNLLLGIRLLHYQRPLKGLTLVLGCDNPDLNIPEFLKLLRYFFKKTSGQVIVCPVASDPTHPENSTWDVEKITNDIKSMKIKARSAHTFKEAFEAAEKTVDERHGLVVVTGSATMITQYWKYKGIKKL